MVTSGLGILIILHKSQRKSVHKPKRETKLASTYYITDSDVLNTLNAEFYLFLVVYVVIFEGNCLAVRNYQ